MEQVGERGLATDDQSSELVDRFEVLGDEDSVIDEEPDRCAPHRPGMAFPQKFTEQKRPIVGRSQRLRGVVFRVIPVSPSAQDGLGIFICPVRGLRLRDQHDIVDGP